MATSRVRSASVGGSCFPSAGPGPRHTAVKHSMPSPGRSPTARRRQRRPGQSTGSAAPSSPRGMCPQTIQARPRLRVGPATIWPPVCGRTREIQQAPSLGLIGARRRRHRHQSSRTAQFGFPTSHRLCDDCSIEGFPPACLLPEPPAMGLDDVRSARRRPT